MSIRFYKPRHFDVWELVDPMTYSKFGDESLMFLDPEALQALDAIRDLFDVPVFVNTWYNGGRFRYRGFRPPECTEGAKFSQHRFGRAFDFHINGILPEAIRRKIILKQHEVPGLSNIRAMENGTPTWVHIDTRNIAGENIYLFNP